jgi:hypothetical protein
MNHSKKIFTAAVAALGMIIIPLHTVLADASTCAPNTLCNPLNVSSIQDVLYLIVNIATYIGVILAVLALIWVGFRFIAAQGNPEKLKEARGFFYAVIIGIAILIGANAIVTIMKNTLTSAGVVKSGVFGNP